MRVRCRARPLSFLRGVCDNCSSSSLLTCWLPLKTTKKKESNCPLLLGVSQWLRHIKLLHLTETTCSDVVRLATLLRSVAMDITVACAQEWSFSFTGRPPRPMRSWQFWWTIEALDACIIYFYFILQPFFSKCLRGVLCYVAAMSTVCVSIPGVKWCWQIKILLFGYLKVYCIYDNI